MGKRKAEDEEWGLFKDEILQLYAKHTLPEVMNIMAGKGFRRTKNQYRERLKRWRDPVNQQSANIIRTNITAQEWKYIVERIDERQEAGKSSSVTVRGFEVPQSRIKKQGRVHSYKSTLEKLAPKTSLTEAPDIIVSTPPERSLTPAMNQRYIDFSLYFERLPWRVFTDHLNTTMRLSGGIDSLSGHPPGFLSPANQVPMDLMNLGTELNVLEARSESYLPTSDIIASTTGSDSCFSLVKKGTQLDLLKYLVGMVSNCHDDPDIRQQLRELIQDKSNLKFLSRFVCRKELTVRAFVEKLFNLLLDAQYNWPDIFLVKALLDAGVDLNAEQSNGLSKLDCVLRSLQQSENESYGVIALELLIRGATLCTPRKYLIWNFAIPLSPLNLLILCVDESISQSFMEFGLANQGGDQNITLGTFVVTAYRGYIELFQKLGTLRPLILAELRKSPWLLFEAAAFGGRLSMIKYLREAWFDITLTDSHGGGNPLVFAFGSSAQKEEVVQYLLDLGIFIHRCGNGAMLGFLEQPTKYNEIEVIFYENIQNITPIHAATIFGNEAHVKTLLERGANANQRGIALPIQLSALIQENDMAVVLLVAGADPNLTTQQGPRQERGHPLEDLSTFQYQTALLIAVQYNNLKTIGILHIFGAEFPIPPLCTCNHKESSLVGADRNPESSIATATGENEPSQEITHLHTHHDIENNMCAYNNEYQWNPLLLARSEDVFSYLLDRAPIWLKYHWTSRSCFLRIIQEFSWCFISHQLRIGTFPTSYISYIDKEALLLESIRNGDDQWSYYLVDLPYQSMLRGFVIAASLCQTKTIQEFLEKGLWPDDSVLVRLEQYTEKALYSPLDLILFSNIKDLRSMIVQHYKRIIHIADSNNSVHLEQAYSIAVRCGCIELAELVRVNRDVNDAKFTGGLRDPDMFNLRNSPKMEIHSAVQIASAFCQVDTVIWLLNQGADPNISYEALTDPSGYHSPLQSAVRHDKTALAIALLEKGARVNDHPLNARGATALQFAAMSGNFEMLKILLEAGADINSPPSRWEGRTAIEGAAEQGRLDMVSFLMEAGANIQGRENVNYRRTVYRAWAHGHYVLAKMVQQWKSERYGPEDCEPTKSIIRSMDMATLGCAEQDRLELPDSSMEYYDPCQVCKVECIRDGYSESCEDECGWDGDSE